MAQQNNNKIKIEYDTLLENLSIDHTKLSSLEYFSKLSTERFSFLLPEEIKKNLDEIIILSRDFLFDIPKKDSDLLIYYAKLREDTLNYILKYYDIKYALKKIVSKNIFSKTDAYDLLQKKNVSEILYGDLLNDFYTDIDLYLEEIEEGFKNAEQSDDFMLLECKKTLMLLNSTK